MNSNFLNDNLIPQMSLEDQTGVYHLQTKLLFLESFNDQIRVSYYFLLTFDGNLVVMFSQSEDRI